MQESSAQSVLASMITPSVLISASGMLLLYTSTRLGRVVDRVRVLAREAEVLQGETVPHTASADSRRTHISDELEGLASRVLLLRTSMTALYAAIGMFVLTSIAVGIVALFEWRYGWSAVACGLAGAAALLHASLLLVREARLAVTSSLREMSAVRELVAREREGRAG